MNLPELFTRMVLWISAALVILPPLPSPVLYLLDTPSNFIHFLLDRPNVFSSSSRFPFCSVTHTVTMNLPTILIWLTRWKMMSKSARSINLICHHHLKIAFCVYWRDHRCYNANKIGAHASLSIQQTSSLNCCMVASTMLVLHDFLQKKVQQLQLISRSQKC